jgi:hypothetical protein
VVLTRIHLAADAALRFELNLTEPTQNRTGVAETTFKTFETNWIRSIETTRFVLKKALRSRRWARCPNGER